jgi:chromosome segregation ATPase
MPHEEAIETPEFRIPPFYERFQEERDKRFSSEIGRLEAEIRHNGESISDLKTDIARLDRKIDEVREELKADIARLDRKIDEVREELKADIASLRGELKTDIAYLRREMQSQFRWMMSLLLPIILGVVALLIQNLLHP